jgi:hypothetical protein
VLIRSVEVYVCVTDYSIKLAASLSPIVATTTNHHTGEQQQHLYNDTKTSNNNEK